VRERGVVAHGQIFRDGVEFIIRVVDQDRGRKSPCPSCLLVGPG